jgi:hypothetical protein
MNEYFSSCKPSGPRSYDFSQRRDNLLLSAVIVSGNPNAPGTIGRPDWPKYDPANPRQMTFTSKAEVMPDNIRAEQLGYWMSIAEVIPR